MHSIISTLQRRCKRQHGATHEIIISIFNGRESEHTDERHERCNGRQRRDERNKLQHQKAREIEIGQTLELLEHVQRKERQQRVFRRLDVIVLQDTASLSIVFF